MRRPRLHLCCSWRYRRGSFWRARPWQSARLQTPRRRRPLNGARERLLLRLETQTRGNTGAFRCFSVSLSSAVCNAWTTKSLNTKRNITPGSNDATTNVLFHMTTRCMQTNSRQSWRYNVYKKLIAKSCSSKGICGGWGAVWLSCGGVGEGRREQVPWIGLIGLSCRGSTDESLYPIWGGIGMEARGRRAEAQSGVQIKDLTNISLSVLILWCLGGEIYTWQLRNLLQYNM